MSHNMKELQSMIKSDLLVLSNIRDGLTGCDVSSVLPCFENLQYEKVDEVLKKLKQQPHIQSPEKIIKLEKEIEKVREQEFHVCQYLNTLPIRLPRKVIQNPHVVSTSLVWNSPSLSLVNSNVRDAIKSVLNQRIPVILDREKIVDLTKMPHLLVAGQTGSGKSVFLNAFITTALYKMNPNECKLVLIDPKRVEFSLFKKIPHLWRPVATELDKISDVLDELVQEMESRYKLLETSECRNLESYNKKFKKKLYYIVVVIDELADLMMVSGHSVENQITRLAQLARAVGIHIIMATQRPVVEIMTGLIKANMPSRVSFKVASKQDSRIILDRNGAENLKGAGDMFFLQGGQLERHQGVYVSEDEIKKITREKK